MRLIELVAGSLLAVCAIGAAVAQDKGIAALDSTGAARANPSLSGYARGVRDDANRRDFTVRRLDVEAEVRGAVVDMSLDMQFAGSGKGTSEAWLHLDLPDGAVVTGYALDIDGTLVDGVLVDQQAGREAYERKVREGIDPGIAEVDRSGGLNVRVFPVDAEKGRRIRVRFVAPIGNIMRFPLVTPVGSGTWSVAVRGLDQGGRASLRGKPLSRSGPLAVAAGSGRLDTALVIEPQDATALASRHPLTGETFWQLAGSLPASKSATGGSLRIYWDRSRSMREANLAAVMPRLKEAIDALRPSSIEFVTFNSSSVNRQTLTDGDALTKAIRGVKYEGASSFSRLDGDGRADNCILVSDGRQTIDLVADWKPTCRLFVVPAGPQADNDTLADLAGRGGGRLIAGPSKNGDWQLATIERVVDAGGRELDFTALNAPTGKYRLIVKQQSAAPVRLIVSGQSIAAPVPGAAKPFAGDGALLAARSLTRIENSQGHVAFVDFSRRYSVASPTLSFIVLEDPDDYIENEIEPPATYPEMAEYRKEKARADENKAGKASDRFADLLKAWQNEVAWWERKFNPYASAAKNADGRGNSASGYAVPPPPPPPPAPAPVAAGQNGLCPDGSSRPPGSNCPPPPPPPPPPPEPERDSADADQDDAIVVTGSRIARPDLQAPSPITTVDADKFEITGTVTVETLLDELPQVMAYDRNPSNFDRLFNAWERKVGDVPAFYLDTAQWLWRRQRQAEAVETLLSALELPDSDSRTINIVAARLQRWGRLDLAVQLRERQVALEPNRPQPKRLLALALAERAKRGSPTASADYQRAIKLLVEIALSDLKGDWEGIDIIALREANALFPRYRALGGTVDLDPRLIRNLTADVRVVLDWPVDDVDLDLWVDEPNGERAIYSNPKTTIGGRLSNDMTDGFGPEDYWLRVAPQGTFTVRTNNYDSDRIDPNGRPRLQVRLIRNFGRPNESEESIDFEARPSKDEDRNGDSEMIGKLLIGRPRAN